MESSRVFVRPLSEADLPDLLAINGDERVTRFLGRPPWKEMAEAEAWFQRISALREAGSAVDFAIIKKAGGGVIGRCGLFEYEVENASAVVGYLLGRDHWGQGYMREALTALIDCSFKGMDLRRLEARVEAGNLASSGLLRRLGFIREGVLRERWLTGGEPTDAEVYGLLRHEWAGQSRLSEATAKDAAQSSPEFSTFPS
ncbi:MAG: GNAT family N-acetyltransferase [Verrucomicrobiota bacterium]